MSFPDEFDFFSPTESIPAPSPERFDSDVDERLLHFDYSTDLVDFPDISMASSPTYTHNLTPSLSSGITDFDTISELAHSIFAEMAATADPPYTHFAGVRDTVSQGFTPAHINGINLPNFPDGPAINPQALTMAFDSYPIVQMNSDYHAELNSSAVNPSSFESYDLTDMFLSSPDSTFPIFGSVPAQAQRACDRSSAASVQTYVPMEDFSGVPFGPCHSMDSMVPTMLPVMQSLPAETASLVPRVAGVHRTVKERDRQVNAVRRFVCTQCGLSSERRYNHETHLRTHNPDPSKMFPCPHDGCDKTFTRRHDLKRHLESKCHRHN